MTKVKDKDLPWNRDAEVPNGKPKGGLNLRMGLLLILGRKPNR